MSESLFISPRTFRVWLYAVGHSTLLLRSNKTETHPTRIDVLFKPVEFLSLPCTTHGLDIHVVPTADAPRFVQLAVGSLEARQVYALSRSASSWVVSGIVAWHEDDGDYTAPSKFSVPSLNWNAPG